jgi:cell division topological specificity factor
MFNALRKKWFGSHDESKSVAKSRLHFVLVQDRTGLTSEEMSVFKEEMVKVIERYFVIDKDGFDIKYARENDTTTLLINSPVIVRRTSTPLARTPAPPVVEVTVTPPAASASTAASPSPSASTPAAATPS